ncbi:hypothetical protein QEH56_14520 [Pelagicoccus enzymogenes]|uniref:hypothetical protein n=1 Tax=Pelagicoccus enzymogenes TaxID=2773457 RepID=UPI00281086FC|nr:hypothetical protein [Pelagicoccus enzymogenes]MDQ8199377.1 hypothetical protein [Pelagicoccus enzymogenes]
MLCGSFARYEMVKGSDCDWTLLVNGVVNNSHTDTARFIDRAIAKADKEDRGIKSPGSSGVFGNISFSHNLVHCIGGGPDSNENLTRRALMLLESRPVSLSDADDSQGVWEAVVRSILKRYFQEEVHFSPNADRKVPRFLLNDLTRYWRTICVDYAAKHWDQAGAKWALRNAKIRFSRKLLYSAGMAFCYACQLDPPQHTEQTLFGVEQDTSADPFIELAMKFTRTPPLEYLAGFVDAFVTEVDKRQKVSNLIFGSYDKWLALLNDDQARKNLSGLSHENAADGDATFQHVRDLSKEFADGLKLLFFNRMEDEDPIANLSLEYVGF